MEKAAFNPFQNEAEIFQLGDLTVENRKDRISIFGSIDVTRDKEGLGNARQLKAILDATMDVLERADLPDHIEMVKPKTVKNPFA